MASIQERTGRRGKTYAVLFRDAGRQRSRTFVDESSAEQYKAMIERMGFDAAERVLQARNPEHQTDRVATVAEHLRTHIAHLSGVTNGTIASYRTIADQIAATPLGQLPLDCVTRADVTAWIRDQEAAGSAAKTIRNRQSLLSAALTRAVEDELISRNPAHRARIARTERREMTFLTPDEFTILLSRATPHYHPLLMALFGTGLRLGEATALQVRDLHLDHSPATLTVARAWKRGGTLGPPKTSKGRRTIALPPELVDVLRATIDGRVGEDWVFVNMAGGRVLQGSLHDLWQRWIADTVRDPVTHKPVPREPRLGKVPRIHDLRHSHASWMIARGVNLNDLRHRLGHESIQTTSDVYGHLLPEAQIQAARAASWLVRPAETPAEIEA